MGYGGRLVLRFVAVKNSTLISNGCYCSHDYYGVMARVLKRLWNRSVGYLLND